MQLSRPRTLILIVAYNAETTLRSVLDRIPQTVLEDYDCEVLVIDDASSDETFSTGLAYRQSRPDLPLTVLRNPENQGYGGNQKLGYFYAMAHGFDLVALVHGDGQYAPEELPRLLAPLRDGEADAVMGSRMLTPGAARKGGMPLYKLVGNRILTTVQNRLAGADLSEWHSGFRLYTVDVLRRLRFETNPDDFSFDTKIILQLLGADATVVELPIPTYYGDEICRVDGIRYAGQVTRASVTAFFHRMGLLYRRDLSPVDAGSIGRYDVKLHERSSHTEVLARVDPGTHVIDLGAGPGAFASALADKGVVVTTADLHRSTVVDPRVSTHVVDLNKPLELPLDDYDQVLLLDVIEHLADPETFLEDLRFSLGSRRRELVLTTPNIAFAVSRLMLVMGQFNYGETGILDRTHTRLFTFRTIRTALHNAGWDVQEVVGIPAPYAKAIGHGPLASLLTTVNSALIRVAPRLFSYQILVTATSRPHAQHRLATTTALSAQLSA